MSGYIEKRGKNYRLTVTQGYDHNGKQIRYRKTVRDVSKAEAKSLLAEYSLEIEKNNGDFQHNKNMTLEEFVLFWWNEYVIHNHSPKTQEWHKHLMARVLPVLGHIKLVNLKPTHFISFYNTLRKTKLSSRTIQMHHKFLSSVLGKAEKWQFIDKNPCKNVDTPYSGKTHIPIFDEQSLKAFLTLLEQEPLKYKLFCLLSLATGLRRGEALGLTWDAIDFNNCTIAVSQIIQYVGGHIICKKPKTETSIRTIATSNNLLNLFNTFRIEQNTLRAKAGDKWEEHNFIFTQSNGKPMFPSTIYTWLIKMLKRNNLPLISVHSFRHMSATFLISSGVNIKSVSARLGHAKVSTTADIYAHALQSTDRDSADRLDELINNNSKKLT